MEDETLYKTRCALIYGTMNYGNSEMKLVVKILIRNIQGQDWEYMTTCIIWLLPL